MLNMQQKSPNYYKSFYVFPAAQQPVCIIWVDLISLLSQQYFPPKRLNKQLNNPFHCR